MHPHVHRLYAGGVDDALGVRCVSVFCPPIGHQFVCADATKLLEAGDFATFVEKLFPATEWTYSTVRTLMDRMVAKGLLMAEKVRNVTLYRSAVTRQQAQRGEVLYALQHAFNGALTPMVQCLIETSKLSERELDDLETLIKAKKRQARK